MLDAAGSAQGRVLDTVGHLHVEIAAVSKVSLDLISKVVEGRYNFGDTVTLKERKDVLHNRLIANGHKGLGAVRRYWAQTRTFASRHDYRFDHPLTLARIRVADRFGCDTPLPRLSLYGTEPRIRRGPFAGRPRTDRDPT